MADKGFIRRFTDGEESYYAILPAVGGVIYHLHFEYSGQEHQLSILGPE